MKASNKIQFQVMNDEGYLIGSYTTLQDAQKGLSVWNTIADQLNRPKAKVYQLTEVVSFDMDKKGN